MIVRKLCSFFISTVLLLALVAPGGMVDANDRKLRIGVRSEANPFSFRIAGYRSKSLSAGPLQAEGYSGYMAYICDAVLKEMAVRHVYPYDFELVSVDVVDVDDALAQIENPALDRFELFDRKDSHKIDILCDPATISAERVRQYAVSPPLFVTGISYLTLKGTRSPVATCAEDRALIGVVGSSNAIYHGVKNILQAGEWERYRSDIIEAVRRVGGEVDSCGQASYVVEQPAGGDESPAGVIWIARNHRELARQFCNNKVTYYVGDFEIISTYARSVAGCETNFTARTYSVDRYAIFADLNHDEDEYRAGLISRFFEVLNREIATTPSLLDRAYTSAFGFAAQSKQLEVFYWSLRGAP